MVKVNVATYCRALFSRILATCLFLFSSFYLCAQYPAGGCSLPCNGTTHISLDLDCEAEITYDLILSDDGAGCSGGAFLVQVLDEYDNIIPSSPFVTGEYVGQTLTAKILDDASAGGTGNTCWGYIVVEDYSKPIISNCTDTEYSCSSFSTYVPEFYDACDGDLEPILLNEIINPLPCDPLYIKEVVRTYTAVDKSGNYADECTVTFSLNRIDFYDIDCPNPDYTVLNGNPLSCDGTWIVSDNTILDTDTDGDGELDSDLIWDENGNGYPDVDEFPVPSIDGVPLFPDPDFYCNIGVFYTDLPLPTVDCTQKIMRTWNIREWWCSSELDKDCIQIFEIVDHEAPVFECIEAITVSTNVTTNPHDTHYNQLACGAEIKFPLPTPTDNCSDWFTYDLTYPGGHTSNYDPDTYITLPMGENEVTLTVYDECYNSSTCVVTVFVVDNTPPVAVCDEYTVVGLTIDGKAHVLAETFDDGSYDDCELKKMLVRRMDPTNCDCHRPEYPDMDYIGEYENHHYYLSQYPEYGHKATKFSEAMGGYVAYTDNAYEAEWIDDAVYAHNGTTDYHVNDVYDVHYKKLYVLEIEDPCTFSKYTEFCCADLPDADAGIDDHLVVFRVVDACGNFNDCMVNVSVQDKLGPSIVCLEDETVECDTLYDVDNLGHLFGQPTYYDNCEDPTLVETVIDSLNQCNVGKLIRKFTVTDKEGNSAECQQVITFVNPDPFTEEQIIWPEDVYEDNCLNVDDYHPDNTGYPDFLDDQCDLVGANWDDQLFLLNNQDDNACFKILRTWSVIDWCQELPTGNFVHWYHTQIIKVISTEGPELSCPEEIIVCTYDADCMEGHVQLTAATTGDGDQCTEPDNLTWSFQIDLHCNGSIDSVSTINYGPVADASDTYPLGEHCITWSFSDQCGNVSTCLQYFNVLNCKSPTPYCINGLAVDLMPVDTDGDNEIDWAMVEIWAKDFDAGSYHPCGYPVILSFESDTSIKNLMLDCTTLGEQDVEIWATIVLPDTLIQSYCETYVVVQDNNNACPTGGTGGTIGGGGSGESEEGSEGDVTGTDGSGDNGEGGETGGSEGGVTGTDGSGEDGEEGSEENTEGGISRVGIEGVIATEMDDMLSGVSVTLNGSDLDALTTDEEGQYAFPPMDVGGEYTVSPYKNDDITNGVTTLDIVQISKHILSNTLLDTPYKMIAADVNHDEQISAVDLIELRKIVLGIYSEFPNNTSWRFIDKSFEFAFPNSPLQEAFPEAYNINSLDEEMFIDFLAIKVGDVNNSAEILLNDGNIENRSSYRTEFIAQAVKDESGQIDYIQVNTAKALMTYGTQFTLELSDDLVLNDITHELDNGGQLSFGFHAFKNNKYTVSIASSNLIEIGSGEAMITLDVTTSKTQLEEQDISLSSDIISSELYDEMYQITTPVIGLDLQQGNEITYEFKLYQNTPNPFTGSTEIRFVMPISSEATLTITDISGKVLAIRKANYDAGLNTIEINSSELNATGVLYYTLKTDKNTATKKMVVIR